MDIGLMKLHDAEEVEKDLEGGIHSESTSSGRYLNISAGQGFDNKTMDLATFEIRVYNVLYGYILFLICLNGIIGNLLVILVLARKALRSSTTGITLRVMAVADTLVCITSLFRYKTFKLFMSDEDDIYSVYHVDAYLECYVEPLFWISLGASSFSTLLLSLERYLAVRFPIAVKQMCSVGVVCIFIMISIALVIIVTLPMFLSYSIVKIPFQEKTVSVAVLTDFGKTSNYPCNFNHYVIPFLWYIIPWMVLTVVNILLSRQVHKSSRIRVGVPGVANPNRNLSLLVILVVLVYMVCNFPMCAVAFYEIVTTTTTQCLQETREITNPNLTKAYIVLSALANVLVTLNSCLNISIYCLVGSKFRKELKLILLCEPCKNRRTVHVSNTFHITLPRDGCDSSFSRS